MLLSDLPGPWFHFVSFSILLSLCFSLFLVRFAPLTLTSCRWPPGEADGHRPGCTLRPAGSLLEGAGLAGGGAGRAAVEGLGWQETQDLPGGLSRMRQGAYLAWSLRGGWLQGMGRLPDQEALAGRCGCWLDRGRRRARPGRRGHPGLSGTTRLRHWETEFNCRAGMRIQASPTPPSCKQWLNYVKRSRLEYHALLLAIGSSNTGSCSEYQ